MSDVDLVPDAALFWVAAFGPDDALLRVAEFGPVAVFVPDAVFGPEVALLRVAVFGPDDVLVPDDVFGPDIAILRVAVFGPDDVFGPDEASESLTVSCCLRVPWGLARLANSTALQTAAYLTLLSPISHFLDRGSKKVLLNMTNTLLTGILPTFARRVASCAFDKAPLNPLLPWMRR